MSWSRILVGVHPASPENTAGWLRILAQEGLARQETAEPAAPITVFADAVPDWLERYIAAGGIAVCSGVPDLDGLLPRSCLAVIHRFRPPGRQRLAYAPGLARLFAGDGHGECRLHENRKVKEGNDPDRFPAVVARRVGQGTLIATGLPLTALLASAGDSLRRFSPYSELTERVASVDKAEVADTLVWMLRQAFRSAGLPYIRPSRYPDGHRSVFIFRVDVDGLFGDRAKALATVAARHGIRGSFFVNAAFCQRHPGDLDWPGGHEVGSHGYEHNVYDSTDRNERNITEGAAWVRRTFGHDPSSFVAPRGLWNPALDEALARVGVAYSSDFALDFDSLPFRTPAGVLQIPVHPFSPERASVHAEEHGLPPPGPDAVRAHYLAAMREQMERSRPVHLYGHPAVLGAMAEDVLPAVFEEAAAHALPAMTLGAFCAWWQARERVDLQLWRDDGTNETAVVAGDNGQVPVEVFCDDDADLRVGTTRHRVRGAQRTVLTIGPTDAQVTNGTRSPVSTTYQEMRPSRG